MWELWLWQIEVQAEVRPPLPQAVALNEVSRRFRRKVLLKLCFYCGSLITHASDVPSAYIHNRHIQSDADACGCSDCSSLVFGFLEAHIGRHGLLRTSRHYSAIPPMSFLASTSVLRRSRRELRPTPANEWHPVHSRPCNRIRPSLSGYWPYGRGKCDDPSLSEPTRPSNCRAKAR